MPYVESVVATGPNSNQNDKSRLRNKAFAVPCPSKRYQWSWRKDCLRLFPPHSEPFEEESLIRTKGKPQGISFSGWIQCGDQNRWKESTEQVWWPCFLGHILPDCHQKLWPRFTVDLLTSSDQIKKISSSMPSCLCSSWFQMKSRWQPELAITSLPPVNSTHNHISLCHA